MSRGKRPNRVLSILPIFAAVFAGAPARAQESEGPAALAPKSSNAQSTGFLNALGSEAKLYLDDGAALFTAPFHWTAEDRKLAAGVVLLVAGTMVFDTRLANESNERRSSSTNSFSSYTTGLGASDAWILSGGLAVSGLVLKDQHLSVMGREGIEASVMAGLIANILKPVFGRERPPAANNTVTFEPGSKNYSFPSGHATEAFSVASVIAARSSGWIIPTLAYAGASAVAFDRVNDRAHFPSDVVAGAALGIVVGRFIVHRHERASEAPATDISLAPLPHGLGLVAHF